MGPGVDPAAICTTASGRFWSYPNFFAPIRNFIGWSTKQRGWLLCHGNTLSLPPFETSLAGQQNKEDDYCVTARVHAEIG
jgi:hypothetical protein